MLLEKKNGRDGSHVLLLEEQVVYLFGTDFLLGSSLLVLVLYIS